MGRATDLAQRKIKTGENAPTYRLIIDERPISAKLFDGTISYSSDGNSDLSLSTDMDLSDYVRARVTCEVGYGEEKWAYFGGWLEEPEDNFWGGPSSAVAYGPFKELSEVTFDDDVSYAGLSLGHAIVDIHQRAGRAVSGSSYEIRGNPDFLLTGEEAGISISTTYADGINTLLDLAGWVSVDSPGFVRRYHPRRKLPSPEGEFAATYTEAHFAREAFQASPSKNYGSVGAFKRLDTGEFEWPPVVVPVNAKKGGRFGIPRAKTYWLEDYEGEEEDAREECAELAQMMSRGTYSWALSAISANPELGLGDTIHAHTTELRDEGGRYKERYGVRYAARIDTEASIDISREGNPMNISGETAILLSERRLPKPFYVSRGYAPSAVVRG